MSRRLLAALFAAAAALLIPGSASAQVFGGADRDVPLARFQDPLCPGIVGVQLEQAQEMVSLIRAKAHMLGLSLADSDNCDPNAIIAVVEDPRGFANKLRKDRPYLFADMNGVERQALFDAPGPARTWTRVLVRTRDGLPVYHTLDLTDVPHVAMEGAQSLITVPTRRDILASLVLIDRKAVQGMSVRQVADYATLRALSGNAADQLAMPHASILDLFADAGDKPAGLTPSDWIFLRTLYSTTANVPASVTLSLAGNRIADAARRKQ